MSMVMWDRCCMVFMVTAGIHKPTRSSDCTNVYECWLLFPSLDHNQSFLRAIILVDIFCL